MSAMFRVLWLQSGGCGGCNMSLLCADTQDFAGLWRSAGIELLWHPSLSLESGNEVLTILDDCLSAVDTQTEERILEHLRANEHQTMIVIAHRLSSVMHCDRIIVLKDGRVLEEGSHETLVAAGGWYARTFRRQLLKKEIDAA